MIVSHMRIGLSYEVFLFSHGWNHQTEPLKTLYNRIMGQSMVEGKLYSVITFHAVHEEIGVLLACTRTNINYTEVRGFLNNELYAIGIISGQVIRVF